MTMTRKWSLLAMVVVVAVFAAGWFLLISPKRGEAADLRQQSQKKAAANEQLVQQLQQLKAESQDLPKLKAQLATMRKQIPDNPALPTLIRDLTAAGKKSGVDVVSLQPGPPVAVVAAVPVPVATTSTDASSSETSSTDASSGDASTTTTPAAPPAPPAPSLFQVPLKLQITGSYFAVEQFVNKLEGLRRSFLVTGFSLKPGAAATGTATTGSTAVPSDLTLDLDGRVFLSPAVAPAAAAAAPTPAAAPATGTTTP